jgi:UDP-N-acetylglucosamine--N-acetylmuramyl-(pentapeptide) pyrophosphoryl-undecaprenol N-acetylglucosamine transferase
MKRAPKIIISGGGTGGHVYPAIAIAHAILQQRPDANILFVGAKGRLEMTAVPHAGFQIIGLPVAGFNRKQWLKNIPVLFKLLRSQFKAWWILTKQEPDVVVGVGGYASGPMLKAAQFRGIPTLIQEQNSFPGITNRLLAKRAYRICVAYEGMERYFPSERILLTGNPIRPALLHTSSDRTAFLQNN